VFGAGSSAVFETDKPDVQEGSTGAKLIVKTHLDEHGNDVADAFFHDTVVENVTLVASLPDHSQVQAATQAFQFLTPPSPPTYGIALYWITTDGPVIADGISECLARAVVSCSDAGRQQEQIVKFELASGSSASFNIKGSSYIQPNSTSTVLYVKSRPLYGYHIAEACFADTVPEKVTIKASLVGHSEVQPQSQQCEFVTPPAGLSYALISLTRDGQPADGKSEIHARAIITCDGKPFKDYSEGARFLFMSGSPKFDTTKPTDYGWVQANSTSQALFVASRYIEELDQVVADAYFTDTIAEWVILQVSNTDGSCPSTKFYTFYDLPG
jgi:hypothetical protein